MNNKLKCISYNCRSVKSNLHDIRTLLARCDVLFLQEIWLFEHDLPLLQTIHSEFYGAGCTPVKDTELLVGRPFGGVAVLWKSILGAEASFVDLKDDRMHGWQLTVGSSVFLFINVYMPSFNVDHEPEFIECLNRLRVFIECLQYTDLIILGDWNANASASVSSSYYVDLLDFANSYNLTLSDVHTLPASTFTYVSESHTGVTSWLDHVLASHSCQASIDYMSVLYEFGPDHLPIEFHMNITHALYPNVQSDSTISHLNWESASPDDLLKYLVLTKQGLDELDFSGEAMACEVPCCNNVDHQVCISHLYFEFINVLLFAARAAIPSKAAQQVRKGFKPIPGWNSQLSELYSLSRSAFLSWVDAFKPVYGPLFAFMKSTRLNFKKRLKSCRRNERLLRAESLANSFLNVRDFWAKVRRTFSSKQTIVKRLDGVSGDGNIAELWKGKYDVLFNCVNSDCSWAMGLDTPVSANLVLPCVVEKLIGDLQVDKAGGPDQISARHLKLAARKKSEILARLFNAFISHGFVPSKLTDVALVPIPKGRGCDVSKSDNYRPIALATIISKLFEKCILSEIALNLRTSDFQFGFKACHGVDFAIFLFKFVVEYFWLYSSPVFVCFVDSAKAFDRVNHSKILKILVNRGVPLQFIRLFAFWFRNQEFRVRWGAATSSSFHLVNGLRQGGVLSPLLYAVYVDLLSQRLKESNLGCFIGGTCFNHFLFADDLVVLSPSVFGLNRLLSICDSFASELDIVFNTKKTFAMALFPTGCSLPRKPVLLSGRVLDYVSEFRYLGFLINDKLKDDSHLRELTHSLCKRGNMLIWKFGDVNPVIKVRLFKTFCYQCFAISVSYSNTKRSVNVLEACYKRIFRRLIRLPPRESISQAFVYNQCCTFDEIVRKSRSSFTLRLWQSSNSLVAMATHPLFHCLPIWRHLLSDG